MKNLYRTLIVLLCSTAVLACIGTSCSKLQELEEEDAQTGIITSFKATIESGDFVKATVNVNTGKNSWENGDVIKVSNGSECADFTYSTESETFTSSTGLAKTGTYSAFYPADAVSSTEGSVFTISLPSSQTYYEGLVKKAPMSAYSTSETLNFSNLCGILRFKITGSHKVSSIVFEAAQKAVAGTASVNAQTGVLSIEDTENKTLTLNMSEAVQLGEETPFYMIVPAQLYTGGFSVSINANGGNVFEKSTTKDIPVNRNEIDGMKAFDVTLFSGGDGTAENPYKIATEQDLRSLSSYTNGEDWALFVNKNYIQTENISMNKDNNFPPICGSEDMSFSGVYDGNNKYIYDIQISVSQNNTGIFRVQSGGEIKNINLTKESASKINISGKGNVGCIVGYMKGGKVSGCVLEAVAITAESSNCGMIAGKLINGACIENCSISASCSISSTSYAAGGIAGWLETDTHISNCEVNNATISASYRVGGIAGFIRGNSYIDSCTSGAKLQSTANSIQVAQTGGIVGYMGQTSTASDSTIVINCIFGNDFNNSNCTIECATNCTNYGYVGGAVGSMAQSAGGASNMYLVNTYTNPYSIKNTGTCIKGFGALVGGANTPNAHIINCYTPALMSAFTFGSNKLNISNYSSYSYIGSAVGVPGSGTTLDRVYGCQTLRVFNTVQGAIATNISTTISDPTTKNLCPVTYHVYYTPDVSGYTTFKEALDHGADLYNEDNPAIKAKYWTVDESLDGRLKPDGVYKTASRTFKNVSIIGDGISAFRGMIPEGFYPSIDYESSSMTQYNTFYPNAKAEYLSTDVLSERDTWWYKLIYNKMTDARLEMNNSYYGSTCGYYDSSSPGYSSSLQNADIASTECSFVNRYRHLGVGNPDLVIIYGGYNDYSTYGGNSNCFLGSNCSESDITAQYEQALTRSFTYKTYVDALTGLATLVHLDHPSAQILLVCCDMISDEYETCCKNVATVLASKGIDIKAISLHKTGTENQTNTEIGIDKESGVLPNTTGATNTANYIFAQLRDWLDE